ncbi:tenascin-X-like [Achlya hypogyna]|uniref:Tenascin-X-like n=1 Tax=Achlya hypogyna TaxID=1202772 RepID=A0A1V9ZJ60_ACHHY|nr:tenascin-X-like [Achlya hypogyna]
MANCCIEYLSLRYIHGGYHTFFPYPITSGAGAGRAAFRGPGPGYTPFPTNPYYLADLWVYNLSSGLWTEVTPLSGVQPSARTEHSMIAAGPVLVLFGGYMSNFYYQDMWHFNTTGNQWLQQTAFIHALYPLNCTDDLAQRAGPFSGTYAPYVASNETLTTTPELLLAKILHYGTKTFSVVADPERFLTTGRQGALYPQARRQAPGWDGCRDRLDNRYSALQIVRPLMLWSSTDLPWDLQWSQPSQRAGHMAVYHAGYELMLLYGGFGVSREELYSKSKTTPAYTYGDFWSYSLANCIKNCSLHGVCSYGQCICDEGYYGTDCSNSSCPGTVCTFEETTQVTRFEHTDNDTYVAGIEKLPCTATNVHYSNGICDGFGQCICRPPFIGEDCSIRNCAYNCSGHGYCSVEFPNSRCLCDPGWLGKYCDQQVCLNNCSYPNGVCVNGSCYCQLLYEPYNNTLAYFPYLGEDCSFMMPFARATPLKLSTAVLAALGLVYLAFWP